MSILDPIRADIQQLDQRIDLANKDRRYVAEYRDWLAVSWAQRPQHVDSQAAAKAAKQQLEETHRDLVSERDARLKEHDRIAKEVTDAIDKAEKLRREAYGQMGNLASGPRTRQRSMPVSTIGSRLISSPHVGESYNAITPSF